MSSITSVELFFPHNFNSREVLSCVISNGGSLITPWGGGLMCMVEDGIYFERLFPDNKTAMCFILDLLAENGKVYFDVFLPEDVCFRCSLDEARRDFFEFSFEHRSRKISDRSAILDYKYLSTNL